MNNEFIKTVGAAMVAGALFVTLSACDSQGPAESAGEKFDDAVEDTGKKMEEAGDSIRDATTPGGN
ncbi:MAG: hypothetical protein U5S82_18810 [Gammaproteobacteria bacterium]|nr:hypothetical protein [Gammaproteobacteria bacterium]